VNQLRLLLKLAMIPFRRAWVVLGLMVITLAQLFLALWFCGLLQNEIAHTRKFSDEAKLITLQLKEGGSAIPRVREVLEQDEPELVQTVRSIGPEGVQLFPQMLVIRGVVSDDRIEKIKMMTEIARLDQSPVHHARLKGFYQHLSVEIRIAAVLLLLLVLVQLVVFQRIQNRDTSEVVSNLMAWGVSAVRARMPAFLSMVSLSFFAALLSVMEWSVFRSVIWKNNAFLGELSLDHALEFPWGSVGLTFLVVGVMSFVLVFSGRAVEE